MAQQSHSSFAVGEFSTYNTDGDPGWPASTFRCDFACNDVCKITAPLISDITSMSLRTIFTAVCLSFVFTPLAAHFVDAQTAGPITYKTYDQTFYREEPVKAWKWVEQKVTEKTQKSRWVQEYDTQKLERKKISYRPIEKTSERIEKYTELEPVTVTKYREKEIEETSFETAVEMREETVIVKKPVVETVMREKEFKVREKVTEESFEYKPTTTLKPVTVPETTLVPQNVIVPGVTNARPRVQWLRPGTYVDPATGYSVYRRRGLHWTNTAPAAAVVPALIPQTSSKIAYVPETTVKKEPIEISRFVDRVETRKVPVEVERIKETYETRKVPVEVRRPKKTVRVEKIPYKETTYREIEKTRKVPVVEKTMQKVETIEPYERTTAKWVEKVEEVETPKIVRKKIEYTSTKKVPYTVRMCVAVDCFGNPVGKPEPVDPRWKTFFSTTNRPSDDDLKKDVVINRDRRPASFNVDSPSSPDFSLPTPAAADFPPTLKESTSSTSTTDDTHSVLVPETETKIETSTSLKKIVGPPLEVKTPMKPLSPERSLADTVGTRETEETSTLKPVTEAVTEKVKEVQFDQNLLEPPAVPNIAPRTFDVKGIDQVEDLKRRSIKNIY